MTVRSDAYAPPISSLQGAPELIHLSEAETVRAAHIGHEAAMRSVGVLYIVTGVLLLAPIASLPLAVNAAPDVTVELLLGGLMIAATAGIYLLLGFGVRRLAIWSQVPTCLLSLLGLLAFPLGTLLGVYVLYLFLSRKGRFILTERYAAIIDITPHVRRRTSVVLKVVVVLGIAAFAVVALARLAPALFAGVPGSG